MADYQSSHSGPTIDERVTLAATNQADIAALKLRMSSAETSINNKADTSTVNAALATKQNTLVSGTNIKTVGGQSILGSGDITANDENAVKFVAQTLTDAQKAQARTNIDAASTEEVSQLEAEVTEIGNQIGYEVTPKSETVSGLTQSKQKIDTSTGKWITVTNNERYGIWTAIVPGVTYTVTARSSRAAIIAILAEDALGVSGEDVVFATGFSSVIDIDANGVYTFVAPEDARGMYFQRLNNGQSNTSPASVSWNEYSSDIVDIKEEIIDLENIDNLSIGKTATKLLPLAYGNNGVTFFKDLCFLKGVTYTLGVSLSATQGDAVSVRVIDSSNNTLKTIQVLSGSTTETLVWTPDSDYYGCKVTGSIYVTPSATATVTITPNKSETELWRLDSARVKELDDIVFGATQTATYGSSGGSYAYSFLANRRYRVTNTSSSAERTITVRQTADGPAINTMYLSQGQSSTFILSQAASYLNSGGACTVTIELLDGIIGEQDRHEVSIKALEDAVYSTITEVSLSASIYKSFVTKEGERYVFTNKGENAVTFRIFETNDSEDYIYTMTLYPNTPYEYIAEQTGNYIRSGAATVVEIKEGYSYEERISKLETNDALREWIADGANDFQKKISYRGGYTYDVYYPFRLGCLYHIHLKTTTNGAQLVLYFGSTQYKTYSSFPGDVALDFVATRDYERMRFYCGTQLADGEATVEILYKKDVVSGRDFQWGIGINCKYNTPDQNAFIVPSENNRPSYFYNLFDGLVAAYPNYVTKIDCDELANEAGIETPDYMSGCPIYMYKFTPAFAPNSTTGLETSRSVLKVMVVGGTHPELTAIQDLYNTMKIICNDWDEDANLEALRWDAEFYIVPCEGAWSVKTYSRTNYNGVDLNRNMPTSDWVKANAGTNQYSGPSACSEYESKVMVEIFNSVKPHIFIDHHNADINDGKNMVYITSRHQKCVDIGAAHISAMTRRWKKRFPSILPQDDVTTFGYSQFSNYYGSRSGWADEQGVLSFTYESNEQIYYQSGTNTANVMTIATDGFLNFLLRVCKSYSGYNA